jgi:hypothetical protein
MNQSKAKAGLVQAVHEPFYFFIVVVLPNHLILFNVEGDWRLYLEFVDKVKLEIQQILS